MRSLILPLVPRYTKASQLFDAQIYLARASPLVLFHTKARYRSFHTAWPATICRNGPWNQSNLSTLAPGRQS